MGRRHQAPVGKQDIVAAFCDCVIDLGLESATLDEVAGRMGTDGSPLHYYFCTREELIALATEQISTHYADAIVEAISKVPLNERARSLVEFLFGPTFHDARRSRLLAEIERHGRRAPCCTDHIKTLYKRLEHAVARALEESYPTCPAKEREMVSCALSQLCEGATVFNELGFGTTPRRAARQMAMNLLTYLEQQSS